MSMESVALGAGTTVPALYRRYRDKAALAAAVVDSLRVVPLPPDQEDPRATALALLENFAANLRRPGSLTLLLSLVVEARTRPELLDQFRSHLVRPRRRALTRAFRAGVAAGQLPRDYDVATAVGMAVGSFYARYVSGEGIPRGWPDRVLDALWPR
jgi:AcrR family transcriptional regulator